MATKTSAYFLDSFAENHPLDLNIGGNAGTGATRWTVDWGDGTQENVTPGGGGALFAFHFCADAPPHDFDVTVQAHAPGLHFTTVTMHVFDNFNAALPTDEIGSKIQDMDIGGSGVDTFNGQGGDDWFYGNDGDDNANGSFGRDHLFGDDNDDTLDGAQDDDTVYGGHGNDHIIGGEGNDWLGDVLNGEDPENGDDTIEGGDGNDTIMGVNGDNQLFGGSGDDFIYAGRDNDTIKGGGGADLIHAGPGTDTMNGGAGPDRFEFQDFDSQFDHGVDFIESFDTTEDIIAFDVGSGTYDSFHRLHIHYRHNIATITYSNDGDKVKVQLQPGEVLDHTSFDFYDFPG